MYNSDLAGYKANPEQLCCLSVIERAPSVLAVPPSEPTIINRLPASSWKPFHLKSKSSSLSHHTETVTDANGLEDSFLTVSSSSRAVSEWVL